MLFSTRHCSDFQNTYVTIMRIDGQNEFRDLSLMKKTMKTALRVTVAVLITGCGASPLGTSSPVDVPTPAPSASCRTMRGDFDASVWQGLVDSLPEALVVSDLELAMPSVLRAQVYDNSSWVLLGESATVSTALGDLVLSFGGTGYPVDSGGKATELGNYKAARHLFDAFVRATETKDTHETLAAGIQETTRRISANGKVDCTLSRQDAGGASQRDDVYCSFHGLMRASMTRDCL